MTQMFMYLFHFYFSVSFSKLPDASAKPNSSTNELDSILEELLGLGNEVCAHSASGRFGIIQFVQSSVC